MEAGTIDLQRHESGVVVIGLPGEQDVLTVSQLREALAWWFSFGLMVIVDLSETTRIDSAVPLVLVAAKRDRRPIALVAPGGPARGLIDRMHLGEAIPTYATLAEALARLTGAHGDPLAATGPVN